MFSKIISYAKFSVEQKFSAVIAVIIVVLGSVILRLYEDGVDKDIRYEDFKREKQLEINNIMELRVKESRDCVRDLYNIKKEIDEKLD